LRWSPIIISDWCRLLIKTEKFAQAIQKYPDNAETYFLYARLCEQEGSRQIKDVKTQNQGEALQKKSEVHTEEAHH
jgi:hypothetical protein